MSKADIERVARAMRDESIRELKEYFARDGHLGEMGSWRDVMLPWDECREMDRESMRRMARSAIAAIREPSEDWLNEWADMQCFGLDQPKDAPLVHTVYGLMTWHEFHKQEAKRLVTNMIDKMLEDG